ncbi:hypothetical protein OsccyDRAFT_3582 [Leptolyngbyaceae cyanobacterium JSC-12]|nr:hypothetical protein OsccyDRAFT_3582 [Leptolyngbyaceae cyanobacterium JSC-12]
MTWTAYRVVFKLKSPIHIGCGKVGNVQRTRPYVTGRSFWGALTMRLTRNQHHPATDSRLYEEVGKQVHDQLAYTYFYPATKASSDYQIHFPWKDESQFRRRFLSSYASTALVYPQQAADEGLLHEVEFLSHRTLDEGKQVYLIGYVFEKEGCSPEWQKAWQKACHHLQVGGERGYGWGDVALGFPEKQKFEPVQTNELFCGKATFEATEDGLIIKPMEQLLAHTVTANVVAQGEIEPMVGREWRSHNPTNRYAGQYVEKWVDNLCWVPGSVVERSLCFKVSHFGIWHGQA